MHLSDPCFQTFYFCFNFQTFIMADDIAVYNICSAVYMPCLFSCSHNSQPDHTSSSQCLSRFEPELILMIYSYQLMFLYFQDFIDYNFL